MRGRKPKPSASMQGTHPVGPPPTWLTGKAKSLYRRLAADLAEVVSSLDAVTLAAYCQCYSRWQESEAEVQAKGITLDNGRLNPACKHGDALLRQLRIYGAELGLTPLSRGRIEAPPPVGDELDAFLSESAG